MTAVAVRTETIVQLPIAHVTPSTRNPRADVGDVTELAESIQTQGVIEPLIVTPTHNIISTGVGSGERWAVVAGHRRLKAAKLAGLKTVPCIVRQYGEREQVITMLVENLQRQDLAPLQEAKGYQQLSELEYSQREIARQVGKSQSHVAKRLALLKLSPAASAKFESGGITAEDAIVLAAEPADVQAKVLESRYTWLTIPQRVRETKLQIEQAKKPKPKGPTPAQLAAQRAQEKKASSDLAARERAQRKLREEAKAARLKVMPRILSRGERELQYAAGVIVRAASVDETRIAAELLALKAPKSKYGMPDYRGALAKRAAVSKVKAIEVLLALALGVGEGHVRSQWAGPSTASAGHLALLKKAGYKPNAIDRKLLRSGRR